MKAPARRTPEELLVSISIDTECDHDPRWRRSDPLAFESIVEGLPNRLQPAFGEVGAVPTYLLTVEVMEDDASVAALRALAGPHELGTHLHAAFVEPEKRFHDYAGVDSPDFQCSSPPAVEHAKLANLTALFEARFGYRPKSFRAGRYGAGAATIDSLERLGYACDTSVVPYKLWREHAPRGTARDGSARARPSSSAPRPAPWTFAAPPSSPTSRRRARSREPARRRPDVRSRCRSACARRPSCRVFASRPGSARGSRAWRR